MKFPQTRRKSGSTRIHSPTCHGTCTGHESDLNWKWDNQAGNQQKGCHYNLQTQQFYCTWHWEVVVIGNLPKLVEDIMVGEGYAVCNSLFQLRKGAVAWIVEGQDNTNRLIWNVPKSQP